MQRDGGPDGAALFIDPRKRDGRGDIGKAAKENGQCGVQPKILPVVHEGKKKRGDDVGKDSRGRADGSEDHAADQRLLDHGREDDAHGQHHVPVFKNQIVYRLVIINGDLTGQKMLERLHGPCARVVKREA